MSNDQLGNLDELSKPAVVLIEKIEAVLNSVQPEAEIRTWYRRGEQHWVEEQMERLQNINDITDKALPLLNENVNPDAIAADWLVYFLEKSQMESDSELQILWSRILAGEANAPGTYLKTILNFISELDETDIELFTQLCDFAWKIGDEDTTPLVFDEKLEIYNRNEINRETLTHLDNIGLVQFQDSPAFRLSFASKSVVAEYYGNQLHVKIFKATNNELEIGIVRFTSMGQALASVCGGKPVNGFYEYVREQWHL